VTRESRATSIRPNLLCITSGSSLNRECITSHNRVNGRPVDRLMGIDKTDRQSVSQSQSRQPAFHNVRVPWDLADIFTTTANVRRDPATTLRTTTQIRIHLLSLGTHSATVSPCRAVAEVSCSSDCAQTVASLNGSYAVNIRTLYDSSDAQSARTVVTIVFGPENGSQNATNVVAVSRGSCCYQIFKVLRLFHFTTDRH